MTYRDRIDTVLIVVMTLALCAVFSILIAKGLWHAATWAWEASGIGNMRITLQ